MSPIRPEMSIAMPPALGQFWTEGHIPKTPVVDCDEATSPSEPPPPPKQTYKVKRKRVTTLPAGLDILDLDHAIPTIEMSEVMDSSPDQSDAINADSANAVSSGLLSPMPHLLRSVTPPKTPAARTLTSFDQLESPAQEWDLINSRNSNRPFFERSGSVGSSFSDSSLSSFGSTAFSTMSPASEPTDPFFEDEVATEDKGAVTATSQASPDAKRIKTGRRTTWTPAMDDHLWITYMQYLSDPTLTPFKMLPGTAPPLGVCHRVASKAKRTWKEYKTIGVSSLDNIFAVPAKREGSPDTIRPDNDVNRDVRQPQWPRSESETRRRLRALCKRRPSLSAHYQRLLRTRSPSPFQSVSSSSSATVARASEPPGVFSSVDMKISLITSTSSSMQPDGPLAQLATDCLPEVPQSLRTDRPADWFARIGRSQAHQKSLSLQSGLGLDSISTSELSSKTLDSPFDEAPSRSHLLQSMSTTKSLGRDFNRAPLLDSPFEAQGSSTAPRSLKRRFRSDEEKPKRLPLHGLFDNSSDDSGPSRHRGFSVGSSTSVLSNMFNPPTTQALPASIQPPTPFSSGQDHAMTDLPDLSMLGPPGSRSAPRRLAEPTPRLGSPFMELRSAAASSSSRQHNTFPRSYIPTSDNPQPFQQALQELADLHTQHQAQN